MSEAIEPSPKLPRQRRRFGLWALLGGLLLVAAMALTVLALTGKPIAVPAWGREILQERLTRVAPEIDITFGDVSIVVEEGFQPRVHIQDVTLAAAAGGPQVKLSDMRATFALAPLFSGQIRPRGIWLSGAYLLLRRDAEGGFDIRLGEAEQPVQQAANLNELIEELDRLLVAPQLSSLKVVEANALALRYEDQRAQKAWSVDGGRIAITRSGENLSLRGDFSLLGDRDFASTVELSYDSAIGTPAGQFGISFRDMPTDDLAHQAKALAWLEVLQTPISGALRGEIDSRGMLGRLNATLRIGAGVLQPTPETPPVPFSSARTYFTYTPFTGVLQFDELSVTSDWVSARAEGKAVLGGLEEGWPTDIVGQLSVSNILANPAALYPEAIELEGARLEVKLHLDPFRLTIGELTLHDQGQVLAMRGELQARPEGWDLGLNGRMEALELARLKELWPTSLAPKTRAWIERNIVTARMSNIQIGLRSLPNSRPDYYLGFDYDGLETLFMPTMPPIKGASGRASLFQDRFMIFADQGTVTAEQGGAVDIAGTSFVVPDVRVKPAPAEVHLATESTITAALSLLDREPFEFLTKARQPVTLADGRAATSGLINLTLIKPLPRDRITYDVGAKLMAVRSDKIVAGRVLRAAALDVAATNKELVISGEGRIGKVPFEGRFQAPLDQEEGGARVRGSVELSQLFTDEFNITLPAGSLSGRARADVSIDLERDQKPRFELSSNLSGLALRLAPLGWSMGQGATGALKVSGTLASPPVIDRLSLEAPGLSATGQVSLTPEGQLESARFSRVRAGSWLDAPVELVGRGAGAVPAVRVTGGSIDMRKTAVGSGTGSTAGGGPISLALDRLQISGGITLTGFRGDFNTRNGMHGDFTARVNGDAQINGKVVPQGGRSAFQILAKDAGGVLRSAGLLEQARGGDFILTLLPSGDPGSYDGVLKITNTRLKDAPAMAALLNAMSIIGLLEQLGGSGIHFSEVDANFRLNPYQVIITKSSAIGASLGISMDGVYTLATGTMDMQGVVSPVFLLNGIGSMLTRKGEGLLGFNYRLLGTAANPTVRVNPLSIFTPGMFRNLFRRPPPKVRP